MGNILDFECLPLMRLILAKEFNIHTEMDTNSFVEDDEDFCHVEYYIEMIDMSSK